MLSGLSWRCCSRDEAPPQPIMTTTTATAAVIEEVLCPICQDPLNVTSSESISIGCSHKMHAVCLAQLLLQGPPFKCPVCRFTPPALRGELVVDSDDDDVQDLDPPRVSFRQALAIGKRAVGTDKTLKRMFDTVQKNKTLWHDNRKVQKRLDRELERKKRLLKMQLETAYHTENAEAITQMKEAKKAADVARTQAENAELRIAKRCGYRSRTSYSRITPRLSQR